MYTTLKIVVAAIFLLIQQDPFTYAEYNYGCPYGQNGKNCDECGLTFNDINVKISGGKEAERYSWPAHTLVIFEYKIRAYFAPAKQTVLVESTSMCGGILINRNTVVTAAHCIPTSVEYEYGSKIYQVKVQTNPLKPTPGSMLKVYAGIHYYTSSYGYLRGGQAFNVSEVIIHEDYNENSFRNDIAILKLSKDAKLGTKVQLACLPSRDKPGYPTTDGDAVYAVGWGLLAYNGNSPNELQNVKLKYFNEKSCKNKIPFKLNYKTQMCAGDTASNKDTCPGDSGGGIYMSDTVAGKTKMVAAGIVSYGDICGQRKPGVYTRISAYLDWIDKYA